MDAVADVERDQDVVEAVAHFPPAKTQIFLRKHKYSSENTKIPGNTNIPGM